MVTITKELLEKEAVVHNDVEEYAELFDLDPDLVRALITQESRFIGEAVSPTRAFGFGQFTSIGAKQVQLIAAMTPKAADLANFQKSEASDPDRGIKGVCAFLWWLIYRKYGQITDKKLQLEMALTFYNAGGRPAAIVLKHGSHAAAVPELKALPKETRSQSDKYAAEVSVWYVAWHEYTKQKKAEKVAAEEVSSSTTITPVSNPFDSEERGIDPRLRALVEALRWMGEKDAAVECSVSSRDGFTEVVLILPGEF